MASASSFIHAAANTLLYVKRVNIFFFSAANQHKEKGAGLNMIWGSLLLILTAMLVTALGETIVVQTGSSDSTNVIVPSSGSASTIVIKKEPPKVIVINDEPSPIIVQVR
ncbi:uncharacterized protein LOC142574220 [Dermacentor variabilis]|uniref:uncharacterized protein LOC142574220 n=1 Tax=Dermacentor variabilis TaxID=34621 RepID=UPI003F5B06B4